MSWTTPATKTPTASTSARLFEVRSDNARRDDHDDVQQRLVKGGNGETAVAVQHPAAERNQRDEEHVGKREAEHLDREIEAVTVRPKARREYECEHRRRDDADEGDGEQQQRRTRR